jgi:hypothetical protein
MWPICTMGGHVFSLFFSKFPGVELLGHMMTCFQLCEKKPGYKVFQSLPILHSQGK